MKIRLTIPAIVSALVVSSASSGQELPSPTPTARDIYVGCSLFVQRTDVPKDSDGRARPYSGVYCGTYALAAIALREGRLSNVDNSRRFCLPKDAQTTQNPADVMAYAYIDFFETRIAHMAANPGKEAYLAAMIVKWPCK